MQLTEILTIVLAILFFAICILVFIYWNMGRKEKQSQNKTNAEKNKNTNNTTTPRPTNRIKQYTTIPIEKFMEFDKIEDNMIVQDDGKRYLMVIECEGINYDLMSEIEKTSVEQGFIQFLNTLRHPIQLYVQTRTINISTSIENYNNKLAQVKHDLNKKQNELNRMIQNGNYSQKDLNNLRFEVIRIQNMYDYGVDVVKNIEKMSSNKNVLRKHYYIIIPYYTAELGNDLLSEEEKRNMVFSELYTRAQAIIRTLSACSMKGKVMDSTSLVELLYEAYNRDESEVYGVNKALRAGYNELYSTAPDVLDKKMEAINKTVEEKAFNMAKELVDEIKTEKEKIIAKKEKSFNQLVQEMAKIVLNENQEYIGKDVAKEAIKRIERKNTKEEVIKDGENKKARTRRITK